MSTKAAGTTTTDSAATTTETAKTGEEASAAAASTASPKAADTAAATATEKNNEVKEPTFTKADVQRELDKQKKDFEKATKVEADKAKLSEDERKDATIKELQTSLRMRDAKEDVVAALEKAGTKATGLMWNAIKGDLEFDDKGKLTNLDSLVTDLKAENPDQFGTPKPGDSIDAAGKSQAGEKLTREKLAKMSPEDIRKLPWDDVKAAMAAQ